MTIEAKIIADSVSELGQRLTTFELTYPRFVHAEFMTHRVFSRNASSSRAIPIEKMIQRVIDDPAEPVEWGRNQSGMQAEKLLAPHEVSAARRVWLNARDKAVQHAQEMLNLRGVPHKQIVNRILEPWMHITVLVTATDYDNFFHLRCHKDAQPEIRVLAMQMENAMKLSRPRLLQVGDWHLPYVTMQDEMMIKEQYPTESVGQLKIDICVARCARVSYLTHGGDKPTIENDLKLNERLIGSSPLHASPAEHQATPDTGVANRGMGVNWNTPKLHGNFTGWIQYRKTLEGECYKAPKLGPPEKINNHFRSSTH